MVGRLGGSEATENVQTFSSAGFKGNVQIFLSAGFNRKCADIFICRLQQKMCRYFHLQASTENVQIFSSAGFKGNVQIFSSAGFKGNVQIIASAGFIWWFCQLCKKEVLSCFVFELLKEDSCWFILNH